MLLTRQSQIAIGILVACARSADRYLLTFEAASGTGASKEHAAKIAHLLRRAGFVTSVRGRNGGIGLARPARQISIGEVLRHTQPEISRVDRQDVLGGANEAGFDGPGATALASIIETGWASFISLMNRFTIADLLVEQPPLRLACQDCRLSKAASPVALSTESLEAHAAHLHG
ncbi:Rrf2 family transcriptional regulator [Hyphomicrobium sp. D-2]|uniref:RrF2 family transcriptional regulator n=1 Tax=Hyphomicrobium sp. D-2 TaxID=3041621 RepID=UPI002454272C|nr:Rrf2 family transcriptional regulator [Hyphomicrobium sp. D-2]MDH4983719.1 Rrf2 family transcriptional regulator [Hyphomicrobium sp. D-2]